MLESDSSKRWGRWAFLTVWLACSLYMGMNFNKGWDPGDEGTIGQSAERVLHGELPHKDFADPYTGGLALLHAFLFRLFGIKLIWPRLFVFAVFLIWVPALYAIARESLAPWPAAGVTLVAVAWSVPNYPAAMPSWFNLFFATFGTLALAKYIRKRSTRWLVLAGLCGGISFLFKSVAICYVAAALLFFICREQALSRNEAIAPRSTPVYLAFLVLGLGTFVAALVRLVQGTGVSAEYLHFVFPGTALSFALIARERNAPTEPDWARFRTLLQMAAPFLLAAALPVCLFFLYFWHRDALLALVRGVFVAPFRRLSAVRSEPVGFVLEYPSVLAALLLLETAKLRGKPRLVFSIFLTAMAGAVLMTARHNDLSNIVGLLSVLGSIPVLAVAAALTLVHWTRGGTPEGASSGDQQLVLLFAMAALPSLVQFPYSSPGYFCYIAPMAALLAAALLARLAKPPRILLHTAVAFYVLFAVFVYHPHYLGKGFHPSPENTAVGLPRAEGLHVTAESASQYSQLIPFVRNLAGDKPILAGPNCPEIYFLSGIKNQTPVLFDQLTDPVYYKRSMTALIERPEFLKAVVLKDAAGPSMEQLEVLRPLVLPRFPNSRTIGDFTVYWRP